MGDMNLFEPAIIKSADISECGKYRYSLTRTWDEAFPVLCFCMLNPSTADAENDDRTICKCMMFARTFRYGGIVVVNTSAFRATNPADLPAIEHPSKIEANDRAIRIVVQARSVVVAWGAHKGIEKRAAEVWKLLADSGEVYCLGVTKDGHPKHPLYLPNNTKLQFFRPREPA